MRTLRTVFQLVPLVWFGGLAAEPKIVELRHTEVVECTIESVKARGGFGSFMTPKKGDRFTVNLALPRLDLKFKPQAGGSDPSYIPGGPLRKHRPAGTGFEHMAFYVAEPDSRQPEVSLQLILWAHGSMYDPLEKRPWAAAIQKLSKNANAPWSLDEAHLVCRLVES